MSIVAFDVGSTTCKYVLCSDAGEILAQAYERHFGRPAEAVLAYVDALESRGALARGVDRVLFTGSGCGLVAPLVGAKVFQEVVAVAAAVEARQPEARFVSEIGGEDMKTIFFAGGLERGKQVYMQNACSGGTGAFIEKTARKLQIHPARLAQMAYDDRSLHKISEKCGIFAEADANTLLKSGVAVEDIIASLFEAVVCRNLATMTRGNTPLPEVLLLGGPNVFYTGLQQAWRRHLKRLWEERGVALAADRPADALIRVPDHALYFAALGCVELALREPEGASLFAGSEPLRAWVSEGQYAEKSQSGRAGLWRTPEELADFRARYAPRARPAAAPHRLGPDEKVAIGCDFGSTTAKAVCLSEDGEVVFSCYALSKGNPIEDAKDLFRMIGAVASGENVVARGVTGYGKDLLAGIIGADLALVETVAHATAGLRFFPDADCICDVGGTDVKIMILSQGAVCDFRLNSQCSSGNGAFLQGIAERFDIGLSDLAERAFAARRMPQLSMGCGVFLQSDIVNQQRKGWQPEEILAGLCAVLPLNVWIYAGGLSNLKQAGRKFILQGGTHRNLAVVKAQADFIRARVPQAEVVVHPHPGEAGAIGVALAALAAREPGRATRFRGFQVLERLDYRVTTSPLTRCAWCDSRCQRSFVDVELDGAPGRSWSQVPLAAGWERVIVNNSCPKGLIEDAHEVRAAKDAIDAARDAHPDISQRVRERAFHASAS